MPINLSERERLNILQNRYIFANYVQKVQKNLQGNPVGLNIFPPTNDASIIPKIRVGALYTTLEEYNTYVLNAQAQEQSTAPTTPSAPTSLSATPGDGELTISFTPGSDGGSAITNYEYYPLDASGAAWIAFSPAVTTSPVTITGLPNGSSLNFKIRAINAIGAGAESDIVSGTPFTNPSAPTSLSATAGNTQLTISFTAGSDGGSPITNYQYSIDNGSTFTAFSPADTTSPVTITGLTNSTTYQVKLKAVTALGISPESSAVSGTPSGDLIIASLSTSLASYQAASTNDWVKITSTEYTNLQTNITGTTVAGISNTYMNSSSSSGLTVTNQSAIVANSATTNTPAIPANNYVYACAIKYGKGVQATDMRIFTNTNTASVGGFNQVGGVLPGTETGGSGSAINYYVLKGVSVTNGATSGLLSVFTGQTASSAVYIGFYQNFSVTNSMRYLLFTPGESGGIPNSSSSLSGSLSGYGAFNIQALTTATKQWA
jgi:hypothetical protein